MKNQTKIWITLGIIIVLAIIVVGIYYLNQPREEVIKIGFIGPLSSDAAIIGEENLNGIKLAVEKLNSENVINGKKINLIIKDDQMDSRETITQYKQLVNVEGVNYILTVTYGGFIALAGQTYQDNIILVNSLDASEEFSNLGENNFAIGIYDESIGYAIADYLNEKNVKEVGLIINLEDPFVLLVNNAFKNRYKGKTQEENYIFENKDFRTMLNKLSSHEYIVLLGWEETGRIVRQAKELGMDMQFIGIDTFASEDFRKNTNNNYEGLLFTFWQGRQDNEMYNEMISAYEKEFGKEPENVLFVATGYDAMLTLGESLKVCGEDVNCVSNNLRNNIINLKGATGLMTIDSDGITRSIRETIHTYKNGEIVEVE